MCAAEGTDEFEGSGLSAGVWDRVVRPATARHAMSGDRLMVPTYWGGVAAASLLQQELPRGVWEVTTKVTIDAQRTFQQAGLLLYLSDTQYAKLDLGYASLGRSVELVYVKNGASRQDTAAPKVAGTKTLWLRLTGDGTEIRARVSYDGVSFADYGRPISIADAGFTHVGPYAMRGSTGAPEIQSAFGWFRFSPTTDEYRECSAAGAAR